MLVPTLTSLTVSKADGAPSSARSNRVSQTASESNDLSFRQRFDQQSHTVDRRSESQRPASNHPEKHDANKNRNSEQVTTRAASSESESAQAKTDTTQEVITDANTEATTGANVDADSHNNAAAENSDASGTDCHESTDDLEASTDATDVVTTTGIDIAMQMNMPGLSGKALNAEGVLAEQGKNITVSWFKAGQGSLVSLPGQSSGTEGGDGGLQLDKRMGGSLQDANRFANSLVNGLLTNNMPTESSGETTDAMTLMDPSALLSEHSDILDIEGLSVKALRGLHTGASISHDNSLLSQQLNSSQQLDRNNLSIKTAAPSTLTTHAGLSSDFVNRLGEQVMWLRHQNIHIAELRLHPRDLGSVMVRIDSSGDNTSVNFVAAHQTVRDVLDQNMTRLRELFSDAGLNLVNVHVSSDSNPRQEQSMSGSNHPSGAKQAGLLNDEDALDGADAHSVRTDGLQSIHLVDFFA